MVSSSTSQHAADLGVADALVLRRTEDRWAHLGGLGRGAKWAGRFVVDDSELPSVDGARISRFHHREPSRVLGPHYAVSGASVRNADDVMVVLSHPRSGLPHHAHDDALLGLADSMAAEVTDVDVSAQLAAETEVLLAVSGIATVGLEDVWSMLARGAAVAAQSLSCDVAVLRDGAGLVGAISTWGSINVCDEEVLGAALDNFQSLAASGPVRVQDTRTMDLPDPFSFEYGTRSLLVMPLPEPIGGVFVAAHTMRAPRGFTDHCVRLGQHVIDTVSSLATSAMQESRVA